MISKNYALINIQKTIENDHLFWIYPLLKNVIVHSYVSLPEGIYPNKYPHFNWWKGSHYYDAPNYKFAIEYT